MFVVGKQARNENKVFSFHSLHDISLVPRNRDPQGRHVHQQLRDFKVAATR